MYKSLKKSLVCVELNLSISKICSRFERSSFVLYSNWRIQKVSCMQLAFNWPHVMSDLPMGWLQKMQKREQLVAYLQIAWANRSLYGNQNNKSVFLYKWHSFFDFGRITVPGRMGKFCSAEQRMGQVLAEQRTAEKNGKELEVRWHHNRQKKEMMVWNIFLWPCDKYLLKIILKNGRKRF